MSSRDRSLFPNNRVDSLPEIIQERRRALVLESMVPLLAWPRTRAFPTPYQVRIIETDQPGPPEACWVIKVGIPFIRLSERLGP